MAIKLNLLQFGTKNVEIGPREVSKACFTQLMKKNSDTIRLGQGCNQVSKMSAAGLKGFGLVVAI